MLQQIISMLLLTLSGSRVVCDGHQLPTRATSALYQGPRIPGVQSLARFSRDLGMALVKSPESGNNKGGWVAQEELQSLEGPSCVHMNVTYRSSLNYGGLTALYSDPL